MQPNTAANRALMQRAVQQAIRKWEPRIELKEVSVVPGKDPAMVLIHIRYVHRRDGSPGNLVYPFYLEQT
jgi:phage baseplate assembly protein W